MAEEKKEPMSLTAALGNRKKIGGMNPPEAEEQKDPQTEEDAKFADLEARVAALEAKLMPQEPGLPPAA